MSRPRFVHLDDYQSPILSDIARPVLLQPHKLGSIAMATVTTERWPPVSIPFESWACESKFAEHCAWMCTNVPSQYILDYWNQCKRLPALAHLHFLYNPPPECVASSNGSEQEVAQVDLPSDLCICDCALPQTMMPPLTPYNGVSPTLQLLCHCAQVAFRWVLFSAAEVLERTNTLPNNLSMLGYLYCSSECSLSDSMRDKMTSEMMSNMPFLSSLLGQPRYVRTISPDM